VAASGINHFASQKGVGGPAGFKRTILTSYRDIPPFQFYLLTLIFGPVLLAQKVNRQGDAQNRPFMPGFEAAAPFEPVC
jgi:hypothetical protein